MIVVTQEFVAFTAGAPGGQIGVPLATTVFVMGPQKSAGGLYTPL